MRKAHIVVVLLAIVMLTLGACESAPTPAPSPAPAPAPPAPAPAPELANTLEDLELIIINDMTLDQLYAAITPQLKNSSVIYPAQNIVRQSDGKWQFTAKEGGCPGDLDAQFQMLVFYPSPITEPYYMIFFNNQIIIHDAWFEYEAATSIQKLLWTTEVTDTAPAPVPQPIPEPEPIEFSGSGDDVSSKFTLEEGITIITMTHDGDSNFAIELLDNAGNTADLLVNEIGAFGGIKAIGVRNDNIFGAKPGVHLLNITADGNWTVLIKQPRPTTGEALPFDLKGKGCNVSPFFVLSEELTTFSMTHDGNSNFAIELFSANGELEELLANEIGSYTGKKAIGVKQENIIGAKPGIHILSITADGNWTLSISQ